MLRIDLPKIISKLNEQTKLALEQAASLCIEKQQSEIMVEHFIEILLDNPLSDIRVILNKKQIDANAVIDKIRMNYRQSDALDTYPAFSPLLVELLQESWLLCTTELEQNKLRSGAILIAAMSRKDRYFPLNVIPLLEAINIEGLKRDFNELLVDSAETAVETSLQDSKAEIGQTHSASDYLNRFCQNISAAARKGELDPVLCRDDELNLMIDILCRRRKNNPIIVGDAGVGKSAIVEGLALRIAAGQVPKQLLNVELLSLDLGLLQAGAAVKGEFEKRLKGVIDEVKASAKPIIIFIDEAHTLIGSGNQEGGSDAANLLKPALARGELSTIAATTWKEYKKYFEKDPALTRRFQLIKLDEPTINQTVDILRGLNSVYEKSHSVLITDDALKAAAELSARYISGRQLPDKAIDVLDTACARIAINLTVPPRRIAELETFKHQRTLEIEMIERSVFLGQELNQNRLDELVTSQLADDVEKTELEQKWAQQQQLVNDVLALRMKLFEFSDAGAETEEADLAHYAEIKDQLAEKYQALSAIEFDDRLVHPHVTAQQIAEVIADWTGVPVNQMNSDDLFKITNLVDILGDHIKGQDHAIKRIHQHLLTARADLRRAGRPKGAFLLVGPSGVGKTETVVQIAEQLYGGKQFLTTINMSEYQEKHTVSRLIGSPPGYVGYGEGGVLTEAIRKMPYSVVLLDEVEKAHPEVLNIFYQAFDKGELVDGEGRLIDCQNVVFFLTSNLGYQTIVDCADRPEQLEDRLYPELAAFFKPALLARMESIPYLPLSKSILAEIVKGKLSRLREAFSQRYGATVEISEHLIDEILLRANRSENGARMLEAIIDGHVLPPISLALLNKLAAKESVNHVRITVENNEFIGEVS